MNRKLKSTLGLVGLLILILTIGGIYIFVIQHNKIKTREAKLVELNAHSMDQAQLNNQYLDALRRVAAIDSALASRKYNVPKTINQIKFFEFVNNKTSALSSLSKVNVEFALQKKDKEFSVYEYKLTGTMEYNELYKLIYAIEQSRELKKIKKFSLTNQVVMDKDNIPNFSVGFEFVADVYFTDNDRFITSDNMENNLNAGTIYDSFFPLIRNEIPPNVDNLLDVQGARLLAIVPEGAFLADTKGNTYLLVEGDQVYLGYLTRIDTQNNRVNFILNKGGIIEKIYLQLEPEIQKEKGTSK